MDFDIHFDMGFFVFELGFGGALRTRQTLIGALVFQKYGDV